jgi:DNA polymerase-3 subunit delta
VFYVFHGEDEFGSAEELSRLRAKLAGGDAAMAELNTTILDGKGLTLGELRHVCDAIPFMADRRLVIVHGLLSRLGSSRQARGRVPSKPAGGTRNESLLKELVAYLPGLPPTTRLIFVEGKALQSSHPVLKLVAKEGKAIGAYARLFTRPKEGELPGWILKRAKSKAGAISSEAAVMLAALGGNDLRLLDQEIDKLLLYADGRQITTQDVQALVSRAREMSIFDLVDCVGRRQTDRALRLLHQLLDDGAAPLYLLTMLARQVRILIQVKELRAQGLAPTKIAGRLKLHPFVVEKGWAQAQNFRMAQLEAAYQQLVQTDWRIKTGQMPEILALDVLIVGLTRN